jgi:hypothetical protein
MASLVTAIAGCFLPLYPGCGPQGEGRPGGEELLLSVVLASEVNGVRRASGVGVDQQGRSELTGEYTVWTFAPWVVCREMPEADVLQLIEVWDRVSRASSSMSSVPPPRPPYLAVWLAGDEAREVFYVLPGGAGESEVEAAARQTLRILVDLYGDRLVRELQYAGLEDLLSVDG